MSSSSSSLHYPSPKLWQLLGRIVRFCCRVHDPNREAEQWEELAQNTPENSASNRDMNDGGGGGRDGHSEAEDRFSASQVPSGGCYIYTLEHAESQAPPYQPTRVTRFSSPNRVKKYQSHCASFHLILISSTQRSQGVSADAFIGFLMVSLQRLSMLLFLTYDSYTCVRPFLMCLYVTRSRIDFLVCFPHFNRVMTQSCLTRIWVRVCFVRDYCY